MGSVEWGNPRFATMGKHARKGLEREEESWYRERKGAGRVLIAKSSWLFIESFFNLILYWSRVN